LGCARASVNRKTGGNPPRKDVVNATQTHNKRVANTRSPTWLPAAAQHAMTMPRDAAKALASAPQ
jgi:hypothetical protein